jgi:hypothetical protein
LLSALATPAAAKQPVKAAPAKKVPVQLLQKRWVEWAFGSSTNPLITETCELVDGYVFLPAAGGPGATVECDIPAGVPLVGSPGGAVAWLSEGVEIRQDLLAERDEVLAEIANPSVSLDGVSLGDLGPAFSTQTYMIRVMEGSLIEFLEPDNPFIRGNHIRVASGGWVVLIPGVEPGVHELVLSDELAGEPLDITFHLTAE